ncbi:hypothetical protein NPIL_76991 [Nephila pilipes]|uniref:Uncharacterized protein n=1 Tax=Nephila pilipes TaxID=299642 RepID=A0A8X6JN78_NEPPI|nr:hypothetical protein NPIL_76991 [Nephila pilipes]
MSFEEDSRPNTIKKSHRLNLILDFKIQIERHPYLLTKAIASDNGWCNRYDLKKKQGPSRWMTPALPHQKRQGK